jgi:hypothetical protein
MHPPLKVGLIVDSLTLPAWAIKAIEEIKFSEVMTIELVITTGLTSNEKPQPNNLLSNKAHHFLSFLYSCLIERKTYLPNALKQQDTSYLFENITSLPINLQLKYDCYHLRTNDVDTISSYSLDVLIHLSAHPIKGENLEKTKHGTWKIDHSDINEIRGGESGFWESMNDTPVTGVTLRQLGSSNFGGVIIEKSYSCTNALSIKDNINNCMWKSSAILFRKLKELHTKGGVNFWADCEHLNPPNNLYSKPHFSSPSPLLHLILLSKKIIQKIRILFLNRFYFNQWILLFQITKSNSTELSNYKKIIPPKDRFWADPHIIHRGGKYYIYIEEVLYKNRKGHISLIEMNEDGSYNPPKKIIEHDYHMSYPHIVEYENDYYMIPETAENETISIYKCVQFPDKWEFHMHLMENIKAYDATLLFKDNLWWLFANVVESDGISSWDELFIFSSPELLSENWCAHSQNPVISDCRSSRPAGKIFKDNGRIYRPSQNSSIRYGYGLKVNEIIELNQEKYEERLVTEALPNWDKSIIGLHTFNREGNLNIIDAIYKRRK